MAIRRLVDDPVCVVFGQSVLMHRAVRVIDDEIVVEVEHSEVPQVGDELQVVTLDGAVDRAYVRDVRREFTADSNLTTVTAIRHGIRTYDPRDVTLTFTPDGGEPFRIEGHLDGAFIHQESVVGLLWSPIERDARDEGEWPTLAEVGRPWQ